MADVIALRTETTALRRRLEGTGNRAVRVGCLAVRPARTAGQRLADLRLDVNPLVRSKADWRARGSGFLAGVRKGPLVPVSSPS